MNQPPPPLADVRHVKLCYDKATYCGHPLQCGILGIWDCAAQSVSRTPTTAGPSLPTTSCSRTGNGFGGTRYIAASSFRIV